MKANALACALLVGLIVTACTGLPKVVHSDNDRYIVGTSGGIYTQDIAPIRARAFKAANQFCDTKGLVMVPIAVVERPYVLGRNTASVKLTFRAVSKEEAEKLHSEAPPIPRMGEHEIQNPTIGQQLIDLQKAKDAGAITETEYQAQKDKLLENK
jgi:hypothetical protein